MIHALTSLAQHAVAQGCTLSLFAHGSCEVKRTCDVQAVLDAVRGLDDICMLLIRDAAGTEIGRALVMWHGDDNCLPDETVTDYNGTFIDAWFTETFSRIM
jgi:hypothetical protein